MITSQILISHRGNVSGPNPNKENHPDYIRKTLKSNYNVEIDVWYIDETWFLGHDKPQHEVNFDFLLNPYLWIHAKNGDALFELLKHHEITSFWHTDEDWVLTSDREIWTYPGKKLYSDSICVLPELGYDGDITKCRGICSDFIENYK